MSAREKSARLSALVSARSKRATLRPSEASVARSPFACAACNARKPHTRPGDSLLGEPCSVKSGATPLARLRGFDSHADSYRVRRRAPRSPSPHTSIASEMVITPRLGACARDPASAGTSRVVGAAHSSVQAVASRDSKCCGRRGVVRSEGRGDRGVFQVVGPMRNPGCHNTQA